MMMMVRTRAHSHRLSLNNRSLYSTDTLTNEHLAHFFSAISYVYPFSASSRKKIDRDIFKHILDGTLRANNIGYVSSTYDYFNNVLETPYTNQIRHIPTQSCDSIFAVRKKKHKILASKEQTQSRRGEDDVHQ